MKFGPVRIAEAAGAVLAHATVAGTKRFKKGTLIGQEEIRAFEVAGIETVIAASLEENDVSENDAAKQLAAAVGNSGISARPPATGRVNVYANAAGVFSVDPEAIARFNAVDPAITVATLNNFTTVAAGQMVATVKIIPFAVASPSVEKAAKAVAPGPSLCVHPFKPHRVGLIQSVLPSVKISVLDKTITVTAGRLARSGSAIVRELRTGHNEDGIAEAINTLLPQCDIVLVFGASAVCDRSDVVPAAIGQAGGRVIHFGMPVDPGNLLVLGEVSGKPVIGAPGCARSAKENGFDWVLDRLMAGLDVTGSDISGMGVGGLLTEIASRPQPRGREDDPTGGDLEVDAVILAAGRSTRMGGPNKLLARFGGEPLVRKVAQAALASKAGKVAVVTGHQADKIEAAISGLDVMKSLNPAFAEGLSTSLATGIGAVSPKASGALIILGDMPGIRFDALDRMIDVFREQRGLAIVRATHNGKRGNPVIIPRAMFAEVRRLRGDTGAKHLIEANDYPVADVEIGEAASIDVDTPEALANAGGKL